CLSGVKEIEERLESAIKSLLKDKVSTPTPEQVQAGFSWDQSNPKHSAKTLASKFNNLTTFTVITAGLFDGINPCAFVTLVLSASSSSSC
ncbi:MAG: hypothetical protein KAG98_05140, partial [Lentisphaeria bacterium]|nr:hypothetical protein [Lentisphaeria bacterium]